MPECRVYAKTRQTDRVLLAACPNTVREIFLAEAQDWGFALWSAGAALPLLPCAAMLRMVSVCSMAADQQSASMAGALHNCASGAQRSKFIPDSIGLVRQCEGLGTGSLLPVAHHAPQQW